MTRHTLLTRVSLRTVVPLVVVVPVLAVVGALSIIVWVNAKAAAADLERQIFDQAGQRIEQRLNEFVELPGQLNLLNAHLIRSGSLDPHDLRSWRDTLYEQIRSFTTISSIGFATPEKETTWMVRYPDEAAYKWGMLDASTDGQMVEHRIDRSDGSLISSTRVSYDFDPHVRPWYTAAVENPDRQTWTDIYPWVGMRSTLPELGLGLVLAVHDTDGRFLGVHDTELSLSQISIFLANLHISAGGSVYIVDQSGGMVACSTLAPIVRAPDIRNHAHEHDPRARAIAAHLQHRAAPITGFRDFAVDASGEPLRVRVQRFDHPSGLSWSVWIALPESQLLERTIAAQSQIIRAGLSATLIALALGIGLSLLAARPLLRLVDQVRSIGEGDFDARSEVRFTAELGLLSASLNEVGTHLKDRIRLKQSLDLAMEVQQNLLPDAPPPVPGLDTFAHNSYCDETGGDYYDFFQLAGQPASSLGVALGDVAGHGISAALLMATARSALRSRTADTSSLADLLAHTNATLVVDTRGERFMTMLLMVVDPIARSIRWASAGETPPLVYTPSAGAFTPLSSSSLPLGVIAGTTYTDQHLTDLEPGTVIVLSTDGLWETQNAEGEALGIERVRRIIGSGAGRTAREIGQVLIDALDDHCAHSNPADDITFVVVKLTA